MNLTLAIEDELLQRVRELAERRGVSPQQLIRDQLRMLVAEGGGAEVASELLELMELHGGQGRGERFRREDVYEERI